MKLIDDLFKGPGNKAWDLARILGAKASVAYTGAFLYALLDRHAVPDWSALGMGYAAVLAGAGAMIGVKDMAAAKVAQGQQTTINVGSSDTP